MPLSKIQTGILRLLASRRDPESYVAGSTPLTRDTLRYSGDIDIFHYHAQGAGNTLVSYKMSLKRGLDSHTR